MCVFAAALLFLVRWLDFGKWRDGLLFAASAALVLYIHLLFWPPAWYSFSMPRRAWPGRDSREPKRAVLVFALCAPRCCR